MSAVVSSKLGLLTRRRHCARNRTHADRTAGQLHCGSCSGGSSSFCFSYGVTMSMGMGVCANGKQRGVHGAGLQQGGGLSNLQKGESGEQDQRLLFMEAVPCREQG